MGVRRIPALVAAGVAAVLAIAGGMATVAHAQSGCSVRYQVTNQWPSGFTANVSLTNLGASVSAWSLTWSFTAGQRVEQGWNAVFPSAGPQVEARNAGWNGTVGTGGSVSFGFNGSWNNQSNPVPANFAMNGTPCTGGTTSPSASPSSSPSPSPSTSPSPSQGSLPSSFRWSSSGVLAGPKQDSRNAYSIKDFSVVFHNGRWHVFGSTVNSQGYNLLYFNFTDWAQANAAPHFYLDQTSAIGTGYRAAPQVFFFAPQNLWYLVYQTGNDASYSTNPDLSNPNGWSAPRGFYGGVPPIIQQNIGNGFWVDMWVVCDSANCHLFSADDNGHLYRSQTSVSNFPNGMSQPVIAMQDSNRFNLFEAPNVYRVQGTNQYLLLVEAIGSDGRRWFRSWTSTNIAGPWTPLAASESNPFARSNNTTFSGTAWTQDISHGELVRASNDQTLTLSPCNLRFVYQGMDPNAGGDYNQLPWRMGLLTQTNSTC
jgi:Glycosyl hydrolase family 62/Cellulose binding domain